MRVFVYEYTCAAGLGGPLRKEGAAMLRAALADFGRVPGVRTVTLLHPTVTEVAEAGIVRTRRGAEAGVFHRLARSADYTLVVAPECDDLLHTRCRWVEEAGGRLLGPSSEAAAQAGDKLATGRLLHECALPTPPCWPDPPGPEALPFPLVWKPRYGAGCQVTFLARSAHELARCAPRARREGWKGEAIVQPFVPGQPASVAFLIGPRTRLPLLAATQELCVDDRFHYRGGSLPLPPPLAGRAVALARRAVAAIPALRGYVGVDLVLGPAADGSQDHVMEINPRLTTSYVGLRALARSNLAEIWLQAVGGSAAPGLAWRGGEIRFRADGTILR